jgi:O-antigen ligase
MYSSGEYERAGMEQGVGNTNANAVGNYFGFCVMYLTIRGYVETRLPYRLTAWFLAVVCLYAVTLTVSRGPIIAVAASLLVASRRLLKVGLAPVLLLAGLVFGLVELGAFDKAIHAYTLRAEEETGRLRIWPLLIEKFLSSPEIGWGASNSSVITSDGISRSPHNSFLLFAAASGIVPLLLFSLYCFRSGMSALRANASDMDSPFYLPFVVYTVLVTSTGNMDFMVPWAVLSLAAPLAAGGRERVR